MDDLIYVLLGLAWIGYSAYKANQKKTAKNLAKFSQPQSIVNQDKYENEADESTNTIDFVGRLFSDSFVQENKVYRSNTGNMYGDLNSPEPMADELKPESMIDDINVEYQSIEYSGRQAPIAEDDRKKAENGVPEILSEEIISFDLRQAVIHQAILNRPYF
ncbi:MAG TPA: hypothetical protein DCR43_09915 [Bacteroidales bacterium]|nr:MAG: hypothetical protein A2X11_03510 [Bacteroidetes bacterium GWE2_42_24]OFY32708.1 MAG: hypothetical protein A2X09_06610 [Bacteroidetes bacterium GWF2_43_11]HAQ66151.1 hypothetical protein [Bacteroidales bacterium]HBZ65234.1 hypothetical protein [Bacteroidales bacterium]